MNAFLLIPKKEHPRIYIRKFLENKIKDAEK
jgi:hypothetical protein